MKNNKKFLLLIVLVFFIELWQRKNWYMRRHFMKKAIIVKSVADEYKYIRENCPNCQNPRVWF
jgi:hypothetical protein